MHTALFKMGNGQGPTEQHMESAQCYVPGWKGRGAGGEWILVYVWLGLFAGLLKLPQHC